jgi:protein tyrosine phosphatase
MFDNLSFVKQLLQKLESEYHDLTSERDINNNPTKLINLYQSLEDKSKSIEYDYTTANEPKNKPRNRYFNVLPHEKTRFVSDNLLYINANLVKDKYILTQGPMRTYVKEFWTMVWESNSDTIICLANKIENSKTRFDSYYNDDKEQNYYDFCIKVENITKNNDLNVIIREILVTKTNYDFRPKNDDPSDLEIVETNRENRKIRQIHYIGWPDNGTPSTVSDILYILSITDKQIDNPIIVHCSAGIGRSGTFIVIKEILDKIDNIINGTEKDESYQINIPELIFELRNHREGLVQSICQFNFCYKAIILGVREMLNKSKTMD